MGLIDREGFGGLNSDDEDRAMAKGDYRYALNIRNGSSDGDNIGAIENVRGNEIVFYVLPAGNNKVVGSFDDEVGGSIYYLVSNDTKKDSILRFYLSSQTIEKVALGDFNFSGNPIDSIDLINNNLLYWTDGENEPRKINVEKGNDENKNRKVNLYFDIESADNWAAGTVVYTLSIDDKYNGAVYPLTLPNVGVETTTRDKVAEKFAFYINQQISTLYPLGALVATSCGPYIEIEFDFPGESTVTFTADDSSVQAVPVNWYVSMQPDVVNQIKAPLACEPTFEFEKDPDRNINYLDRKTWQFATRLIFDDFEKTVISPISCLAAEAPCIESLQSNCIKVTFTDSRLNDPATLSVIRKVELLVREGNSGLFKVVETIDQWNFGVGRQYYKFYNNENYSVLSSEEAFKLYDTVPLKAGTQEFMKDRLFHGDITEGFDPVCVDADIDVTYSAPPVVPPTYSITGRFRIRSFFNTANYDNYQPIWSLDGSTSVFGGIGPLTGTVQNVGSGYGQTIPKGGFTVYLAGTDYSAVSEQDNPLALPTIAGVEGTVFDGSTQALRSDIRSAITDPTPNNRPQSYFEIKDVPAGKYILRVASHRTEDEADYQKTSTYTTEFIDQSTFGWEAEVEVTAIGIYFNGVFIPGGTFDIGSIRIEDLTDPSLLSSSIVIDGYLTDDDNTLPTFPDAEDLLADTRIERGKLKFTTPTGHNNITSGKELVTAVDGTTPSEFFSYTDHNGFFFCAVRRSTENLTLDQPGSMSMDVGLTSSTLFDEDAGTFTGVGNSATRFGSILRVTETQIDTNSRTKSNGTVTDATPTGLQGITIVPTSGTPVTTDFNGDWSAFIYGNTEHFDATTNRDRQGNLYPYLVSSNCVSTFAPLEIAMGFLIGPANFNIATQVTSGTFVATITFGALINAFKRGFDGRFGLVYRDIGGRMSPVFTDIDLQTHVNFYTETDSNGNQELFGAPTMEWSINHIPPSWATHYQWVRTRNEGVGEYLQWVANKVEYVDQDGNTAPFASAVNVKIDISNLVTYSNIHPSSILGIDADDTYRVRFIADKDQNFFTEYIDLPILAGTSSSEIIIAKSNTVLIEEGTLFEIYRPKLEQDFDLYYEMGECHEIVNNYHSGPTQNQFQWQFDDNAQAAAYATAVSLPAPVNGGNLLFTTNQVINPAFSGVTHNFQVGDTVNIIQDLGATHASYDGQFTVIEIIDNLSIILSIAFAGATPVESGLSFSPAQGTFPKGDVYYRLRTIPTENGSETVFIDDPNVSDFYVSDNQSIGRLHTEFADAKEIRNEGKVVWSGTIFEGTSVNNLNQFKGTNFEPLSQEFGRVYKLQRTENVLLAICQFRTASLYINESVLTTTTGEDSVTKTDKVIGTVRVMRGMYGTVNPESVYLYEGNIYYWDLTTGEVIRYSGNGLQPVSDYKMSNHFRNKSKDILDRGITPPNTVGVYDPSFDEYILCFDEYEEVPAETIAFSETLTRWTTFYSYTPEHIEKVGQNTVVFTDGQVWLQNESSTYNNFNGVQYTSQVRIVSNEEPKNMKVFRSISYESNKPWACPVITIPANDKYKLGMISRLKSLKFINKEGIFYSEFLKDINTPGIVDPNEALINGRDLRGKIIEILLESEETDLVVMFSLNVKSVLSEMSNRQLI